MRARDHRALLVRHGNHTLQCPSIECGPCECGWLDLRDALASEPEPRKKGIHTGAPACFALDLACKQLNEAFGGFHCYLVGSALERADWRDIDVRYILSDDEFAELFPNAHPDAWESDVRWLLLCVAISAWLRQQTGLPVDFQFQPQTHANQRHKGGRNALGLTIGKPNEEAPK